MTIRVGQVYASSRRADVRDRVHQRRRILGVCDVHHLAWVRDEDAIRVGPPTVLRLYHDARGRMWLPNHQLTGA